MKNLKKIGVVSGFVLVFVILLGTTMFLVTCGEKKKDPLTVFLSLDCTECHSAMPKYSIAGSRAGYDVSGHKMLGNSSYANGDGCQQCHTNEGFVEYVANGEIDPKSFVKSPSQPGCFTCHNPHKTGDFSLQTIAAVMLMNKKNFDSGKANLCANCHKARGYAAELVKEMDASKLFSYFGPHYGTQADMMAGTNAFEFPDKTYGSSAHYTTLKDACITCHMTRPEGRFSLSPEIGGHSFAIEGDVHEQATLNKAGCLSCHADIQQVKGEKIFSIQAKNDYDQDGKVEPVQAEVTGLLDKLVNTDGNGILQKLNPPMFDSKGNWMMAKSGTRSLEQVAALYNYKFVLEDRSKGVHNAKYAIQILYDSIAPLDPRFDVAKRPE